MTAPDRKYCRDCAHFVIDHKELQFGRCGRPGALPANDSRFVAPEYDTPPFAKVERGSGLKGDCGPDAIYYQAKAAALFAQAGGGLK